MPGYDLDILVRRDSEDGYKVTRTLADQVRQKFIILLMTIPGERIMNVDFGVGLSTYLFESFSDGTDTTTSSLTNNIIMQARRYMPYVAIEDIQYARQEEQEQVLEMRIVYSIPSLQDISDESGAFVLDFRGTNGEIEITWNSPEQDSIGQDTIYQRVI